MKYLFTGGEAEVVIKKSRFIGHSYPVKTAEEAQAIIDANRKKYWDATHNCYAYRIGDRILKCSDDGEPSRTAGMPILDVITGRDIHNCLIIVTRYFGGTLLGTGGLVSAYGQGANIALDASEILDFHDGFYVELPCTYEQYGKINYILQQQEVFILNTDFTDIVRLQIYCTEPQFHAVTKAVTEASSGTVAAVDIRPVRFAVRNGCIEEQEGRDV